jgi:hypothetical protein
MILGAQALAFAEDRVPAANQKSDEPKISKKIPEAQYSSDESASGEAKESNSDALKQRRDFFSIRENAKR